MPFPRFFESLKARAVISFCQMKHRGDGNPDLPSMGRQNKVGPICALIPTQPLIITSYLLARKRKALHWQLDADRCDCAAAAGLSGDVFVVIGKIVGFGEIGYS
jgi:hypothetical protein